MRAIIDSVHSQAPRTIAKLQGSLDLVVSLDSHLDVTLGEDDDVYPPELRIIASRTGAHTAIRSLLGPPPSKSKLVVAIPERMLVKHVQDVESSLPRSLRVTSERESISSVLGFLKEERGIGIFQSPPESLVDLIPITKGKSWLLDIDVDYMEEMQSECYTRIMNPGRGVLQFSSKVLDFVSRSKPKVITISEARVRAIREPGSNFSKFIDGLRSIDYEVEEGEIAQNDAEVVRGITVCKEFYHSVSKRLIATHMDEMMRGDFDGFREDEETAAKAFFASKGYTKKKNSPYGTREEEVGRE